MKLNGGDDTGYLCAEGWNVSEIVLKSEDDIIDNDYEDYLDTNTYSLVLHISI